MDLGFPILLHELITFVMKSMSLVWGVAYSTPRCEDETIRPHGGVGNSNEINVIRGIENAEFTYVSVLLQFKSEGLSACRFSNPKGSYLSHFKDERAQT